MKKIYFVIILLLLVLTSFGQHISAEYAAFLQGKPFSFSFYSPQYSNTDWIGVYPLGETPGNTASTTWSYIPDTTGILTFQDSLPTGSYRAYLLCCDGYTIYDSTEFVIVNGPFLDTEKPVYSVGDTMVFPYVNPFYTSTDWVGIYPLGEQPGVVSSTIWQYIDDTLGSAVFTGGLVPGDYMVYLLCCDAYQKYDSVAFSVSPFSTDVDTVFTDKGEYFRGEDILVGYNSANYDPADWIGLFPYPETPANGAAVAFEYLSTGLGSVSIPTNDIESGLYRAYLLCCNSNQELATSDTFRIAGGPGGGELALNGTILPEGAPIQFYYNSPDYDVNDWIGIFEEGGQPGNGIPELQKYVSQDSGYLDFENTLAPGNYRAFLLCCDGEDVYASVSFSIADSLTPSLAISNVEFDIDTDTVRFQYHSPDFTSTDWIGIYEPDQTLESSLPRHGNIFPILPE